ncbi:MAG: flagellar export protein FliJ [Gammaproteobacteria bacterium]|nr:flagellar export protein FliJ [Gammaproteobacteria bacterium]
MTRSKKLAPVVEHVRQEEETALQAVAFSQQQLQTQIDRLQQLQAYKLEYENNQLSDQATPQSVVEFQEFKRFLAQLDETIEQQKQVVSLAERELELKRNNWKQTRSRSDAMHKMVDRLQQSEQQQLDKNEQKSLDEFALRNSLKNS